MPLFVAASMLLLCAMHSQTMPAVAAAAAAVGQQQDRALTAADGQPATLELQLPREEASNLDRAQEALAALASALQQQQQPKEDQHQHQHQQHTGGPSLALESVEQLVPNEHPTYQAWSQHLRDHHSSWRRQRAEQSEEDARRRAQATAPDYGMVNAADRVADRTSRSYADQIRGSLRFSSTGAEPGAVTGRDVHGELQYADLGPDDEAYEENGGPRYEHMRSVFSSSTCNDLLAENNGASGACTYSCTALQQHYFPGQDEDPRLTRCFLYNRVTNKWAEDGSSSGDDLLELKQTRLTWRTFLAPDPATDGHVPVLHRGEENCTNVVVQTAGISRTEDNPSDGIHSRDAVETRCLLDGLHEYNHTYDGEHSLVISDQDGGVLVPNTTHAGDGVTTSYYVGDCVDVIIRLETTQAPTNGRSTVSWVLDDEHNDAWTFEFPSSISADGAETDCDGDPASGCIWRDGGYEFHFCMFENDFHLTRRGPDHEVITAVEDGWEGTIAVITAVEDNTIYIPPNENWIIQGLNDNDLPVTLDARLSTGFRRCPKPGEFPSSAVPPDNALADDPDTDEDDGNCLSHANVVIRNVRISGQVATLDKFYTTRAMSTRTVPGDPAPRMGGGLYYEGFGSTLIVDRVVFDHNFATSGAAMMVDGRMEAQAKTHAAAPAGSAAQMTTVTVTSSFFYRNWATWVGGVIRPNDLYPVELTFRDTVMVDNLGFIGNGVGASIYGTMPECEHEGETEDLTCMLDGSSRVEYNRCHSQNYDMSNLIGEYTCTVFSGIKATPGSGYTWVFDAFTMTGMGGWALPAVMIWDSNGSPAGTLNDTAVLRDGVIKDTHSFGGLYGAFSFQSDRLDAERMRFVNNQHGKATGVGGALRVFATVSSRLSHCAFEGNTAGSGAAVLFTGPASRHEVLYSTFVSNIALVQGGAITWQNAAEFTMLIVSSIFTDNQVQLAGDAFSDVTVRLFTAGAGVGGASSANSRGIAPSSAVKPVWFIGPVDNGVSARPDSGEHLPNARDGSIESMRTQLAGNTCKSGVCPDGTQCECPEGVECAEDDDFRCDPFKIYGHTEYDSEQFYNTQTTYAEVLRLSAGRHRLWHGSIISTADSYHTDWDNGGWIEIIGVQDKVFPQFCDNRAMPCPNGVADLEGIYDEASGRYLGRIYDQQSIRELEPLGYMRDHGCYAGDDDGCDSRCSVDAHPWSHHEESEEWCDRSELLDADPDNYCCDSRSNPDEQPVGGTYCCWIGQLFWSYTDFEVPYGSGGAIFAASDNGRVNIRDSTFQNNYAGTGASITATNLNLEITNSTFSVEELIIDDIDRTGEFEVERDHVDVAAATLVTCEDPCEPGKQCQLVGNTVRMCGSCEINEKGDGKDCQPCQPGTEPNSDQTDCDQCLAGSFSRIGVCTDCPAGKTSTDDRTGCSMCPAGKIRSGNMVDCQPCPNGTIADEHLSCTPCEAGKQPNAAGIGCDACPDGTARTASQPACVACPPGAQPSANNDQCDLCISLLGKYYTASDGSECHSCPAGMEPSADRTNCTHCPEGTANIDDTTCKLCEPGKEAKDDGTGCDDCEPGTARTAGQPHCVTCPPGFQPSAAQDVCETCALYPNTFSDNGGMCDECREGQLPNLDRTGCVCKSSTYNQKVYGTIECVGNPTWSRPDPSYSCVDCPDCLNCDAEASPSLKPGWALYGQGTAYRCPGLSQDTAEAACTGTQLNNRTSSESLWALSTDSKYSPEMLKAQCGSGYAGPICGDCDGDNHHLKVGKPCVPCDDGKVDVPMMLGIIFVGMIVGAVIISGVYSTLVDHGVVTDLRLLVGFYQLLWQMDKVLSLEFPFPVPQFLELVGIVFLDLRKLVALDCWDIGGLYGKLYTNIFVVPIICVFGCGLVYMSQKRTIKAVIAAGGSDESAYRTASVSFQQNLFFVVFLLYPMITTTLFRVPQCKDLEPHSFHEDDFSVDCDSGSFTAAYIFALILIVLIPIGVPLTFLFFMYRAKKALPDGTPNTTVLGGAKLCAADLSDGDDRYGFLCRDLRPEYWYYEIVTYARKLLLGGMSVFVGRGTMAQAYFVAAVEAFFLMHHMRVYPYVRAQHNRVDALGHMALMLTYTITLILRNPDEAFDYEVFPRDGYGWFIFIIYAVLLPGPTFYNFWVQANAQEESLPTKGEDDFANPLSIDDDGDDGDESSAGRLVADGAAVGAGVAATSGSTLSRLAKVSREKQELQDQVKTLQQMNEALSQRPATVAAPAALAPVPESDTGTAHPLPPPLPVDPSEQQTLALKRVVENEELSEELRETAKQHIEGLASDHVSSLANDRLAAQRNATLKTLASQNRFNSQYVATMKASLPGQTAAAARESLVEWLSTNRLVHHEESVLAVVGQLAAVEDFAELTEEDVASITSGMTRVEAARFQAAVTRLQTAPNARGAAQDDTE